MKRLLIGVLVLAAGCGAPLEGEPPAGDTGSVAGTQEPCAEGAEPGFEPGMCAPDFTLPDSEGVMTSLSSFRGKVALVDIAALW